jgi:choline dehydrogenase
MLSAMTCRTADAQRHERGTRRRAFMAKSRNAAEGPVDYIVIGAGSAGCAVASRLSEDENVRVLLLEAGGWDDRPEIHQVTLASLLALLTAEWSPQLDWGYATEAQEHLGHRRIPVARGKVVGGCSSVNALMWVRGSRFDYDHWSLVGSPEWAFDQVLPYFKRAEDYRGGGSELRGTGGPVGVTDHRNATPIARAFLAAAQELGYDGPGPDYNGAGQEGFGFLYQTTRTPDGQRCSAATAYLHPALSRPNLSVKVGAQATRLLFSRGRAAGVEYVQQGRVCSAGADQEIIVCCGAFETPKLLMLSGIGAAAQLARHGIGCVQDLPGVGRNLQDHLFVPVCYASRREHPPAELLSEAGLFTRTRPDIPGTPPDLQFTFGAAKFLPADAPEEQQAGPGFTFAPVALQPRSRGEVTLRSADPSAPAVVQANYLADRRDLDVLVNGIILARRLAHTRAFDDFRGAELAPGDRADDPADLPAFVRANATTLWHPVGTCQMGIGPDAVTDPELRVIGVDGLRIADGSIMPTIVSGNTNAACVMIGEKAADLIRRSQRPAGPGRVRQGRLAHAHIS